MVGHRHDEAGGDGTDIHIKCISLSKTFRDFWGRPRAKAVDGIDLEVQRGQVYGLLGPNGSGKSTTIKMLLGLLTPTSGRIAVLGKRPRDVATKRFVGYLPEESYLYRFLSARETLDYYGSLFQMPAAVRRDRVDRLLEMVGLQGVEHRPVGEFSKGMQRRVGLAQSLINDPQLLILDEPTSGMDPVGAHQIKEVIRKLAERGKTILLCTHLLADVEDLCDRVAIMYGGKIRAEGTCDDLLVQEEFTTLQTPALPQDVLQEVQMLLERRGFSITHSEQPRRRLESLFLEIVENARRDGLATSGARSGGELAGFLRDGDDTADLNALTQSAQEVPVSEAAVAPSEGRLGDQHVLENLVNEGVAASAVSPGGSAHPLADAGADRKKPAQVDRSLLDSLTRS